VNWNTFVLPKGKSGNSLEASSELLQVLKKLFGRDFDMSDADDSSQLLIPDVPDQARSGALRL
jgi:hypothetical protein